MTDTIVVEDVYKAYGNVKALNGVSLSVREGKIFGLLGPNGAGKTTLVRILTTLLKPDAGHVEVAGIDVVKDPMALRQVIGLAGQYPAVDEQLTGRENLVMVGQLYHFSRQEAKKRAQELMERFSLTDAADRTIKTYSGGMRRRLDLAASIVARPKVLFLDEPTAGVDPVSRREFWDLLYNLTQAGITIFVTTHYMDEAEHCEQVSFIYFGNIIAHGTPQSIVQNTIPGDIVSFEPGNPISARQQVQSAIDAHTIDAHAVSLFGAAVHIVTKNAPEVEQYIYDNMNGNSKSNQVQRITPSLEDAFIELIHQADEKR